MKKQGRRDSFLGTGTFLVLLSCLMWWTGCFKESKGFVLPPGNIEQGKQEFVTLNCNHCHSLDDIPWTGSAPDPDLKLGGEISTMKMYGELVTSIINPSHKISRQAMTEQKLSTPEGVSKMESNCYNEIMTVQQLVDITAYLQSKYKLVLPTQTYPYY